MRSPYTQKLSVCSPPSNSPLGDGNTGWGSKAGPYRHLWNQQPHCDESGGSSLLQKTDNCHCLQPKNGTDIS